MKFFSDMSLRSRDQRNMLWVVLSIVITGYWLTGIHTSSQDLEVNSAVRTFFGLDQLYRQEGLQRFSDVKDTLRAQIKKALASELTEEEEKFVTNVAVYLFPDLLPDENFEKAVAQEQWAPLQEAIEKKPRTYESRLWFEEMRANIWNYESPDTGKVSSFAKEILKIYNDMSSP